MVLSGLIEEDVPTLTRTRSSPFWCTKELFYSVWFNLLEREGGRLGAGVEREVRNGGREGV